MKKIYLALLLLMSAFWGITQTYPTAQSLPYTQDFGTAAFTAAPTGTTALQGGQLTTQNAAENSAPTVNATIAAATTTTTIGGCYGYANSSNARFYIQESSNATNGTNQLLTAINTGTNTSITVAYQLELINAGATAQDYGIELMYRAGTTGTWTAISGSAVVITGTTFTTTTLSYNVSNLTANQDYQIRWITWRPTGSGASKGVGIDNISITGSATTPTITLNTTGFNGAFGNVNVGSSSTSSSFTVAGSNLTNDITVTPPSGGFEIRTGTNTFSSNPIILTQASGSVITTTIDARFTPASGGAQSGNIMATSTGATSRTVAVSGTGVVVTLPTKLAITTINPASPIINTNFSVTIQAQDNTGTSQNVSTATNFTLSVATGTGTLGGTITGTIPAGSNSATISGVTYNTAEMGVSLTATRTAGDNLTAGTSATFTVLGVATHLSFTTTPASGVIGTSLSTITVSALRADNTVDPNYTQNVTLSKKAGSTGAGAISGTLIKAMVAGVANFTDIQFDQAGSYMIDAISGTLTGATSPSITITPPPTLTEVILPQYMQGTSTTNNNRLPYVYRVTLSNLLASATYRFINQVVTSADGATTAGAGNQIFYNGAGAFTKATTASLSTTGNYSTFTTDASGNYTGWFITEPTGNARFAAGSQVYMRIILNNGGTGTTAATYLTTTNTVLVINLTTASTVADGTGIYGLSQNLGGNLLMLYDNMAGTGRPIASTFTEDDGLSEGTSYANFYQNNVDAKSSAWGTIVPNILPNGIKRIEYFNSIGASIYANTSSDGSWNGVSTVNPATGTTPLFIDRTMTGTDGNFVINTNVILLSPVTVAGAGVLNLINGLVTTSTTNMLTLSAAATFTGGNNASFVLGPVTRNTAATTEFIFPVGKGTTYKPVSVIPTTALASVYVGEYFAAVPPTGTNDVRFTGIAQNEYLDVSRTSGSPAQVQLTYNGTNTWQGAGPSGSDIISVAHLVAGVWLSEAGDTKASNYNGPIKTGLLASFSPFTFGYGPATILPITLTTFDAVKTVNGNLISWKTTNAVNFDHFELQRQSQDGTFATIATINTNAIGAYSFVDNQQSSSTTYYKLKMVDKDGKTAYSKVVAIVNSASGFAVSSIYPTVTNNLITIEAFAATATKVQVSLYNMNGQSLLQKSFEANQSFKQTLSLASLSAGIYMLKVVSNDTQTTFKVIKE